MSSLLPQKNETTACDRRLSRTARDMIQRQVLPIVRHYLNDNQIPLPPATKKLPMTRVPTSMFDDSIGATLPIVIQDPSCSLHPNLDLYRDLERSVLTSLPGSRMKSPRRSMPHWFQCGLCGKKFATRYYLDLHQSKRHDDSRSMMTNTTTPNVVCLADTICPALGGCDERALQLEPHYARGSGGVGTDAPLIRLAYLRQLPICSVESIAASRQQCTRLMSDCFPSALAEQLHQSVCEHFSCHGIPHRFVHRHWYMWRDEWEDHYHGIQFSWMSGLFLTGLAVFYLTAIVDRCLMMSGGRWRNREGRRLLLKDKRAKPAYWLTKWFRRTKVKNKVA